MKKWEKEIIQKQLTNEQQTIWRLEKAYKQVIDDVNDKILVLKNRDQTESVIYQLRYQEELKKQVEGAFDKLYKTYYSTVGDYLKDCYEDSFYSTMYSLHQEGIPLVFPMNQVLVAQAASQDTYALSTMLSKKLYQDTFETAGKVIGNITRGIASNASYATIAANVASTGKATLNQAMRIVRTESHRITSEVKMQTLEKVKDEGADVVKQWDSAIDRRTRNTHVELDGQLREIDQPFKIPSTGQTAMYPGGFGIAKEDINCRCAVLQRARWALDKSELEKSVGNLDGMSDEQLEELAKKFGTTKEELIAKSNGVIESDGSINHRIKANNYNEFKTKYKKKEKNETAKYQAQLDLLEQEKENWKKANNLDVFDDSDVDILLSNSPPSMPMKAEWEGFKTKKAKIQGKLGITPSSTPTPAPTTQTGDLSSGDFDTLKKNAVTFSSGGEADRYHREKNFVQNRWDNDLTENERNGIITYTSNAYSDMNSHLRSDDLEGSSYAEQIKYATKGLEKTHLAEDTLVYRGMGGGGAFSAWTGVPVDKLSSKSVQDSLIGTRLVEKGFMSTGTNPGSAWSGIKLDVYLPKGTQAMYVDPISRYQGEYEILVQRNSTFEIEEIVSNPTNGYIEKVVLRLVEQTH